MFQTFLEVKFYAEVNDKYLSLKNGNWSTNDSDKDSGPLVVFSFLNYHCSLLNHSIFKLNLSKF